MSFLNIVEDSPSLHKHGVSKNCFRQICNVLDPAEQTFSCKASSCRRFVDGAFWEDHRAKFFEFRLASICVRRHVVLFSTFQCCAYLNRLVPRVSHC